MNKQLNANIRIHNSNETSVVLRVYTDSPIMKYLPGQYGSLGLISDKGGKLVKRAYSIACSMIDLETGGLIQPDENEYLEFYINKVKLDEPKREQITPKIFNLKDGDRIFCGEKIIGHYTIPNNLDWENIFLISTHTGESPNNSIVNYLIRSESKVKICNINVGNSWESIYRKEHELLQKLFHNYRFIQFIDKTINYTELSNFIDKVLLDDVTSERELGFKMNDKTLIMLCGDPIMIGAPIKKGGWEYEYPDYGLVNLFKNKSYEITTRFKKGNIVYESYW